MKKQITIKDKLKVKILEEGIKQLQWALYFYLFVALGLLVLLIIIAFRLIH